MLTFILGSLVVALAQQPHPPYEAVALTLPEQITGLERQPPKACGRQVCVDYALIMPGELPLPFVGVIVGSVDPTIDELAAMEARPHAPGTFGRFTAGTVPAAYEARPNREKFSSDAMAVTGGTLVIVTVMNAGAADESATVMRTLDLPLVARIYAVCVAEVRSRAVLAVLPATLGGLPADSGPAVVPHDAIIVADRAYMATTGTFPRMARLAVVGVGITPRDRQSFPSWGAGAPAGAQSGGFTTGGATGGWVVREPGESSALAGIGERVTIRIEVMGATSPDEAARMMSELDLAAIDRAVRGELPPSSGGLGTRGAGLGPGR